jgi:hypothetical protein
MPSDKNTQVTASRNGDLRSTRSDASARLASSAASSSARFSDRELRELEKMVKAACQKVHPVSASVRPLAPPVRRCGSVERAGRMV